MTLYVNAVVVLYFPWFVSKLSRNYLHLLGVMDYTHYLSLYPLKLKKSY